MVIVHGCCVGSWDRFAANVLPPAAGRPVYALSGQTSIGRAYNTILDAASAEWPSAVVVLQHDDLLITDPDLETKLVAAATEPDVAVVGVAGARGVSGIAWWNFDTVGHQTIDTGLIDFGPREGDVDALEGSFLAFTPWAVRNLRFDPDDGFHGYDVTIARKAVDAGKRAVVADIHTHHHTQVGFKTAASEQAWYHADQRVREGVGHG